MSTCGLSTAITSPLEHSVDDYLRVLANERGVSEHTLRAYRRELQGFAAWVGGRCGTGAERRRASSTRTFAPIWARFMSAGFQRLQRRGRWRRFAAGSNGWRGRAHRTERGLAGFDSAAAQAFAARSFD